MVIQSNDLPFQVRFVKSSKDRPVTLPVTFFTDCEEDLMAAERPGVELIENTKYDLVFECEVPDAQLYLDVLDALPIDGSALRIGQNDVPYVVPGKTPVQLYLEDYIPWIPSIYHICVCLRGKMYFSTIRVVPKLMTESQLEVMRRELRQDLRRLAFQLSRRQWLPGQAMDADLPGIDLLRVNAILDHAHKLVAAVMDLIDRANFKIIKTYERVPATGSVELDSRSIRENVRRSLPPSTVLSPRRVVSHDLPENRWVVFVSEHALRVLEHACEAFHTFQQNLEHDLRELWRYASSHDNVLHKYNRKKSLLDKLEQQRSKAVRLIHLLRTLQMAPWYQSIKPLVMRTGVPKFTHVLIWDARYRAFHELQRALTDDEVQIDISSRYALQWRPTSELYEIWGFIQIIKELIELGFIPSEGWLIESSTGKSRIFVDDARPGMSVTLRRADLTVRLVYECELPARADQTRPEQPLYTTQRHNRPDGLLHVYKEKVYVGSLIFDMKYRQVHQFWNLTSDVWRRPHAMEQICSYEGGCKSSFLYGYPDRASALRPVREVWAIHPSGPDAVDDIPDYNVKLVRLTPGQSNIHLGPLLESAIASILQQAAMFGV